MARSLLLLITIIFGGALPAAGWIGSNPLPVLPMYNNKLAGPGEPPPLPVGVTLFIFGLEQLRQNNKPLQPLSLPTLPVGSMKQPRRTDPEPVNLEASQDASVALPVMGAAGGDDGDKPPARDDWKPDPEPQPVITLVLDPVQKCLQQKRQLLRILRMKQRWATLSGNTTLARILSDRIMVIEADLRDLEMSDPAMIHPGLVQTWLATDGRELNVYHELASGKDSGRQAQNGEGGQPSGTAGESAPSATSHATEPGRSEATGNGQDCGSTVNGSNGSGGSDAPPAGRSGYWDNRCCHLFKVWKETG